MCKLTKKQKALKNPISVRYRKGKKGIYRNRLTGKKYEHKVIE